MNTLELAVRHDIVTQVKNRDEGEEFILVLDSNKCWSAFGSLTEIQDFAARVAVQAGCQASVRDLDHDIVLRFE